MSGPTGPFGAVTSREMDAFRADVDHRFDAQGREIRDIKQAVNRTADGLVELAGELRDFVHKVTADDAVDEHVEKQAVSARLTRGERSWAIKLVVFTNLFTAFVAVMIDKLL